MCIEERFSLRKVGFFVKQIISEQNISSNVAYANKNRSMFHNFNSIKSALKAVASVMEKITQKEKHL